MFNTVIRTIVRIKTRSINSFFINYSIGTGTTLCFFPLLASLQSFSGRKKIISTWKVKFQFYDIPVCIRLRSVSLKKIFLEPVIQISDFGSNKFFFSDVRHDTGIWTVPQQLKINRSYLFEVSISILIRIHPSPRSVLFAYNLIP